MDSSEEMNMDPDLYKAAQEGNIHPFENYQNLDRLLTSNENTILHTYLSNQRREMKFTGFVDRILEMCTPLLLKVNKKGETPLHLAARYGHYNVVKVLIDHAKALATDPESGVTAAKKMLRMTNEEGDTALHEAARMAWSNVVKILTKEDREFSYSANFRGETPLYIAVSSNTWRWKRRPVIHEILKNCISVNYGGPNGITALHAAIKKRDKETAKQLLEKEKSLAKTTDQNGWSPLHFAAYFFDNNPLVKVLLEYDASAVYNIADEEKKRTALHIAAIRGKVGVMKGIVSRCPACCEQVDNRGWNALHYAVASKRTEVVKNCLEIPEFARLKTKKDDKGNTPFHLLAALALEDEQWGHVLISDSDSQSLRYDLNKQNLSAYDIYSENLTKKQKKEILESLEDAGSGPLGCERIVLMEENNNEKEVALDKARESHLVVAALIATVTFAAGFNLPGGYKNDEGTAILSKKPSFITFIISDAIAMALSISAVFIHFLLALHKGLKVLDFYWTIYLFSWATWLTMIAMGTMVIAFVTGTHAVLVPTLGLAITTCLIGMSFFYLACLWFWNFSRILKEIV